jgi:upstream activation factor subunit UAF30
MNSQKILHQFLEASEKALSDTLKNKKETFMAKKKKAKAKKRGGGGGLTKMTYTLSASLQAVVGKGKLTRPQIVKKLWAYIKSHRLQDAKKRRLICPDTKLAEVFGSKRPVDMLKMSGLLNKHIKK